MKLSCPVPGCGAGGFQTVRLNGIALLVCDFGHVISRDYSVELERMANTVSAAITGVAQTVAAHVSPIRKQLAEIKDVADRLAEGD